VVFSEIVDATLDNSLSWFAIFVFRVSISF